MGRSGLEVSAIGERVVIATKFGIKMQDGKQGQDSRTEQIRKSVEGSLRF